MSKELANEVAEILVDKYYKQRTRKTAAKELEKLGFSPAVAAKLVSGMNGVGPIDTRNEDRTLERMKNNPRFEGNRNTRLR